MNNVYCPQMLKAMLGENRTILAKHFDRVYRPVSYLFFLVALSIIILLIYSYVHFGYVSKLTNRAGASYKWFYSLLVKMEIVLLVTLMLWAMLSGIAVFKQRFEFGRRHIIFGLIGLVISVIYILIDPFGLVEYLLD